MSDDDWLHAIAVYNLDREYSGRDGRLFGGAVELSRLLETATTADPGRFVQLSRSFDVSTNPYYFNAILLGLRKSDAAKGAVFDVVRRFFSLPGWPGARWMSNAVVKYAAEDIPVDVLNIVGQLATEAADPELDDAAEAWSRTSPEDEHPDNYLNRAINTTRGSAAEDIGYLIHADAERVEVFRPYLIRMVADPTVTVRSAAAHALCGLFAHDEELAVGLFLRLCDMESDALLATRYVDRFLHHGNPFHFAQLQAVVQRMLASPSRVVREAGGRHACLAQFSAPEAVRLAAACVAGDEALRSGAAKVAAANVFTAKCRQFCEAALGEFFDDSSGDVRDSAARRFLHAKGDDLGRAQELIRRFLRSASFPEHGSFLVMGLMDSTAELSGLIIDVCTAVLAAFEGPSAETLVQLHLEAEDLAELVFRAYSQSQDPGYRERCLDLIDGFVAAQAYGVAKQIAGYER